MTLPSIILALQSAEVELTPADFAGLDKDAAIELRDAAAELRAMAPRARYLEHCVERGLDAAALRAIADNYDWAAEQIEQIARAA